MDSRAPQVYKDCSSCNTNKTLFYFRCVSSGSFHVLSVKENVEEVARKPSEFSACAGKCLSCCRRDTTCSAPRFNIMFDCIVV